MRASSRRAFSSSASTGLDSIELLSVDMDFSSNYSRSVSSLIVLTKFFQLVSDLDKKFRRKLIFLTHRSVLESSSS